MGLFDRAKQRAGSLIGDANAREVKRLSGAVEAVAEWESEFARLRDDELAAKTTEFIERLEDGASLDDILPEAFAVVREAATSAGPDASLRRADRRRNRSAPGQDLGDADGRGQDAGGDAGALPQRTRRRRCRT